MQSTFDEAELAVLAGSEGTDPDSLPSCSESSWRSPQLTPTQPAAALFSQHHPAFGITVSLCFNISVAVPCGKSNRLAGPSLQVLTDLIMVSLVVHETGGWDSSLNFLYPSGHHCSGHSCSREVWGTSGWPPFAFILYGAGCSNLTITE